MALERFQRQKLLGSTGLASLYLAYDPSREGLVALKVLRPFFSGGEFPSLFREGMEAASRLEHPLILPVYEFCGEGKTPWLAREYVPGGSLREEGLPLAPSEAFAIALDLARALEYAHARGAVHRNIKPSNVFWDGERARLADFGLGELGERAHPLIKVVFNTPSPPYMSPEQAQGFPMDGRSDIYALGTLLYYLLTSRLLALDTQGGHLLWEFPTGNPVYGSPIVFDGVVYFGSGDGNLYALE